LSLKHSSFFCDQVSEKGEKKKKGKGGKPQKKGEKGGRERDPEPVYRIISLNIKKRKIRRRGSKGKKGGKRVSKKR